MDSMSASGTVVVGARIDRGKSGACPKMNAAEAAELGTSTTPAELSGRPKYLWQSKVGAVQKDGIGKGRIKCWTPLTKTLSVVSKVRGELAQHWIIIAGPRVSGVLEGVGFPPWPGPAGRLSARARYWRGRPAGSTANTESTMELSRRLPCEEGGMMLLLPVGPLVLGGIGKEVVTTYLLDVYASLPRHPKHLVTQAIDMWHPIESPRRSLGGFCAPAKITREGPSVEKPATQTTLGVSMTCISRTVILMRVPCGCFYR
jgi:hypothetical protein